MEQRNEEKMYLRLAAQPEEEEKRVGNKLKELVVIEGIGIKSEFDF